MINRYVLALLFTLLSSPAFAQTVPPAQNTPAVDDVLKKMEALGVEAGKLKNPPVVEPPPVVVPPTVIDVPPTANFQNAINAAMPGQTLALVPGGDYSITAIVSKLTTGITITTKDCTLTDAPTAADLPNMARVHGAFASYALWVMGSKNTFQCLHFGPNPNGSGDMLRVGDSQSPVLADVPDDTLVRWNYFHGDPGLLFGQKRAIAANGSHLTITQNTFDNIWAPNQDSQCIAVFSTPGPVLITRNICAAAGENVLIGGVPPAGPEFIPSDVEVSWNAFYKPLAWKVFTNHQIKNLFEIKIGHRIHVHHNWFENHWKQAQPGPSIVYTMATNGACSYCDGIDWTFDNNIVVNVSAGIVHTGFQYTYAPGAGQVVGVSIRNNLFRISKAANGGTGYPLFVSNEPKSVTLDHNTFIHDGTSFVYSEFGTKWPIETPPLTGKIPAGPLLGFVFTNNIAAHGTYGIFTTAGSNGLGIASYFPSANLSGNVLPGVTSSALGRYNVFAASGNLNVGGSLVVDADGCTTNFPGKGADCTQLPWELESRVPR